MSKNTKITEVTIYNQEDVENMFNDITTKANSNDLTLDEVRDIYINVINHINNHVFIIDYLKQLSKKLRAKCENHNINNINDDNDDLDDIIDDNDEEDDLKNKKNKVVNEESSGKKKVIKKTVEEKPIKKKSVKKETVEVVNEVKNELTEEVKPTTKKVVTKKVVTKKKEEPVVVENNDEIVVENNNVITTEKVVKKRVVKSKKDVDVNDEKNEITEPVVTEPKEETKVSKGRKTKK